MKKPQKIAVKNKVRTCRICGCTDEKACQGGCYWVEPDLCSTCRDMIVLEKIKGLLLNSIKRTPQGKTKIFSDGDRPYLKIYQAGYDNALKEVRGLIIEKEIVKRG